MGLFTKKKNSDYFSNDELQTAGVCPNCWGEQEYDRVIRDLPSDKQINVNNGEAKHAFIQAFVTTHVDGIHLKKGTSSMVCEKCSRVF